MKMIIILIFLFGAIISVMALIISFFKDEINKLESELSDLEKDLESHCKFGNDDINFELNKLKIDLKFLEGKVNYQLSKKTEETIDEIVIYGGGKEVARYKLDDEFMNERTI